MIKGHKKGCCYNRLLCESAEVSIVRKHVNTDVRWWLPQSYTLDKGQTTAYILLKPQWELQLYLLI